MMFRNVLGLGLVLAVLTAALLIGLKRTDSPTLTCETVNTGANDYKILIVGESWACDGRLFPELPQTVSDRLHGRGVQTCSLCYPGRNSKLLYTEMTDKLYKERIYEHCGKGTPDKLIIMNGVNDEIQHIGEKNYVEYTKKLVDFFDDVKHIEVISIPRVSERKFKSPNLYSRLKRFALMCFYDGCDFVVNDRYRAALWRDHPELHMIEFDNFIEQYEGNEQCYLNDGVHLTEACSHKYGAFIGNATALQLNDYKPD